MKKIVALIPGIQGLYESLPLMIQEIAGKDKVIIAVDVHRVQKLIQMRKVSLVVIILGAKKRGRSITAKNAYEEINKTRIPVRIADGVDWGLPGQIILPGRSFKETLKAIF